MEEDTLDPPNQNYTFIDVPSENIDVLEHAVRSDYNRAVNELVGFCAGSDEVTLKPEETRFYDELTKEEQQQELTKYFCSMVNNYTRITLGDVGYELVKETYREHQKSLKSRSVQPS